MDTSKPFKWRHFQAEIILLCVRWYLNNLVEQDHRFIKRLVKLGMGFFSSETAWRTLQGYEAMNMLRKGQIDNVDKRDSMKQVAFIASLFGVAV